MSHQGIDIPTSCGQTWLVKGDMESVFQTRLNVYVQNANLRVGVFLMKKSTSA